MNLKTTISKILTAMLVALLFLSVPQTTPAAVQPNLENSVQLPVSSLGNTDNAVYQVAFVLPDYTIYERDNSNYEGDPTVMAVVLSCAAAYIIVSIWRFVLKIINKHKDKHQK